MGKYLERRVSPLIVVLGPTGTGKSQLGLALAESLRGEIVNCDSIQVYRGLEIASAKVPLPARRGIPHHLIDFIGLDEELTAGAYSHAARKVLESLRLRNKVPIVVAGTGFYLKALIEGLSPVPGRDEALRTRLRHVAEKRPLALHRFLRATDPEAARRIHPNDHQKLIRAIELTILAGQPATRAQSSPRHPIQGFGILKLGLIPERSLLYERLNQRSATMFQDGLIAETKAILDAGFSPELKPLQSLGYKQAINVLQGCLDLGDALLECQTKTRQYAKRQITWFNREPDVHWLTGFGDEKHIQMRALEIAGEFLEDAEP